MPGHFDLAARGGPAEQRTHGAGKCADKGGQGGDALERRIDGHIGKGGQQRQSHGEQVGMGCQPPSAEHQRGQTGQNALC